MEGEKQWTYFSGVISILRSVMRDDKINEYEAKAVCGTLNLYDVPGISIFVRGVKLYNKQMVRNLFARNIERINCVLFDLRPKPKPTYDYRRKEPGFSIPKRELPPREPSEMEKASMELLRNDEVFYDNLLENNRRFPSYRDIYNKKYNNMAKKIVRLTESGLHRLISESVKKAISNRKHNINESYTGNYRGVDGVKHIWHGEWADPEVEYDGKLVNYWDIDEYMQDMADSNGINIEDTEALNQFCIDNEDAVKQYIIDNGQPIEDDEEETDWASYEDDEEEDLDECDNNVVRLNESQLKKVITQSAKSILKESSDTDAQWKSELQAFMRGLRNGNYDVSGDTVYVEIWKSRSASNDPRYVSYKRGDNRLRDDHFYMQHSPRLSRRTINAINKRLGWGGDDEYDLYENKKNN